MSRLLPLPLTLLLLAGCATGPSLAELQPQLSSLPPDHGRIFFYRTPMFFADGQHPDILLNGELVGESIPSGFFFVDRPAGTYKVTMRGDDKVTFELAASELKYVRTWTAAGFGFRAAVEHPADAQKDLATSHYTGKLPPP